MVAFVENLVSRWRSGDTNTLCGNARGGLGVPYFRPPGDGGGRRDVAPSKRIVGGSKAAALIVLGAVFLFAATVAADTLDRVSVSHLIKSTAAEIGQPFDSVHIQIADPSDHLHARTANGQVSLDYASLLERIDRQLTMPIDFGISQTIGRYAAFAFFRREMATSLHELSDGSTLCIVFPMAAPVRLAKLVAMLSGKRETEWVAKTDFKAADFYRFLLYHEIAHCKEDPRRIPAQGLGPYEVYLAENRADAFAVLMHMKRAGGQSLPRFMAAIRRDGMQLRGDAEHQTAAVIERTITLATYLQRTGALAGTSTNELVQTAWAMTAEYALGLRDFVTQNLLRPHRQRPLR